jgi:hypothetical protein
MPIPTEHSHVARRERRCSVLCPLRIARPGSWEAPRRPNWQLAKAALSRAQWAPTKGPSRLNQRLGAGGHPRGGLGSWGGQGTGKPVVGSPTHPVMPDLIMLWEMTPLRREVRAGARLWVRGPARRGWVATGPKPKPGGAGGWAPGIRARFWGRRGGQPGYLFKHLNYWG